MLRYNVAACIAVVFIERKAAIAIIVKDRFGKPLGRFGVERGLALRLFRDRAACCCSRRGALRSSASAVAREKCEREENERYYRNYFFHFLFLLLSVIFENRYT